MGCPLCELKRIDKLYYEDDFICIISCAGCHVPMGILKRHTMEPTPFEKAWLRRHLARIGYGVFGRGKFRIDREQRSIKNHLHWHCRRK